MTGFDLSFLTLLIIWRAVSHGFACEDSCSILTTPDAHTLSLYTHSIEKKQKWFDIQGFFPHRLNRAQESSTFGKSQASFALMHPEDFRSILSINVLIEN